MEKDKTYLIDTRDSGQTGRYAKLIRYSGGNWETYDTNNYYYIGDNIRKISKCNSLSVSGWEEVISDSIGKLRPYADFDKENDYSKFKKTYSYEPVSGYVNPNDLRSFSKRKESFYDEFSTGDFAHGRILRYVIGSKSNGKGHQMPYHVPYTFEPVIDESENQITIYISDAREFPTNAGDLGKWQFWSNRRAPERSHNRISLGENLSNIENTYRNCDNGNQYNYFVGTVDGIESTRKPRFVLEEIDTEQTAKEQFYMVLKDAGARRNDECYLFSTNNRYTLNLPVSSHGDHIGNDLKNYQVPFDLTPSVFSEYECNFFNNYEFNVRQLNGDDWYIYDWPNVWEYTYSGNSEMATTIRDIGKNQIVINYEVINVFDDSNFTTNNIESGAIINDYVTYLNNKDTGETGGQPETGTLAYVKNQNMIYRYNRDHTGPDPNVYSVEKWEEYISVVTDWKDVGKISDDACAAVKNGNGKYDIIKYESGWNLDNKRFKYEFTKVDDFSDMTTYTDNKNLIDPDNENVKVADEKEIILLNDGKNGESNYTLDLDNQNILLAVNNNIISNRELLNCKVRLLYGNTPVTTANYKILDSDDLGYYSSSGLSDDKKITINNNGVLNFNNWEFKQVNDKISTTYVLIGASPNSPVSGQSDAVNYPYKVRLTLCPNFISVSSIRGAISGYASMAAWTTGAQTWIGNNNPSDGDIYILDLTDNNSDDDGTAILFTKSGDSCIWTSIGKLKGNDGKGITYLGERDNAPTTGQINDVYKNREDGKLYIYNGSTWVPMIAEAANSWLSANLNEIPRTFRDADYNDDGTLKTDAKANAIYSPGILTVSMWYQIGQSAAINVTQHAFKSGYDLAGANTSYGKFKAYACTEGQVSDPPKNNGVYDLNAESIGTDLTLSLSSDNCVIALNNIKSILANCSFIKLIYITPFGSIEREDIPIVDIKKGAKGNKGENGSSGVNGAVIRGPHAWKSGSVYYDGSVTDDDGNRYIDVVSYQSETYKCKSKTSTSITTAPNNDSLHWTKADEFKFISTDLLLTNTAKIGATTTGSLVIANDNDIQAGIQKTTTSGSDKNDDVVIWAGNTTPSSAPFQVTYGGEISATNAHISGEIIATSGSIGGITITSNAGINASNFAIAQDGTFYGKDMWLGISREQQAFVTGFPSGGTQDDINPYKLHVTDKGIIIDNDNTYSQSGLRGGTVDEDIILFAGGELGEDEDFTSDNCNFSVTLGGKLTAKEAEIEGTIKATAGEFSGYVRMPFMKIDELQKDKKLSSPNTYLPYNKATGYLSEFLPYFIGNYDTQPSGNYDDCTIYYNTSGDKWYVKKTLWRELTAVNRTEEYPIGAGNTNVHCNCYIPKNEEYVDKMYLMLSPSYFNNNNSTPVLILPDPTDAISGFTYHIIVPPPLNSFNNRNASASWGVIIRCVTKNANYKPFVNYSLSGSMASSSQQMAVCGGHLELTCLGQYNNENGDGGWAITQCTGELDMLNENNRLNGAYSPVYGYASNNIDEKSELITKIWAGSAISSIGSKRSDTIYIDTTTPTETN